MLTVYVTIGNTDNRLTQEEWSNFVATTGEQIHRHAKQVHIEAYSLPNLRYQNAIWGFDISLPNADLLHVRLEMAKGMYAQDAIAWSVAETVFI